MSDPTQELAAIRKITNALYPLDLAAQQRVVRYIVDLCSPVVDDSPRPAEDKRSPEEGS